jgi:hypothetical protein
MVGLGRMGGAPTITASLFARSVSRQDGSSP